MNIKVTPNNLTRLEKVFDEARYVLRYEKGTFNSGFCVLEDKKVVVINKFLNLEGRINTLLDILSALKLEEGLLAPESLKLYRQIVANRTVTDAGNTAETPTSEESE